MKLKIRDPGGYPNTQFSIQLVVLWVRVVGRVATVAVGWMAMVVAAVMVVVVVIVMERLVGVVRME